jgi:hypothetical protein
MRLLRNLKHMSYGSDATNGNGGKEKMCDATVEEAVAPTATRIGMSSLSSDKSADWMPRKMSSSILAKDGESDILRTYN